MSSSGQLLWVDLTTVHGLSLLYNTSSKQKDLQFLITLSQPCDNVFHSELIMMTRVQAGLTSLHGLLISYSIASDVLM